jgi:hypothetical protein
VKETNDVNYPDAVDYPASGSSTPSGHATQKPGTPAMGSSQSKAGVNQPSGPSYPSDSGTDASFPHKNSPPADGGKAGGISTSAPPKMNQAKGPSYDDGSS